MSLSRMVNLAFYLYVLVFMLIYFLAIIYINMAMVSISVASIAALLLPFAPLLLVQWISSRYTDGHENKDRKMISIIITSVGLLLLLSCLVLLGVNESKARFTTERWLGDHEERIYMVDDLLKGRGLVGKSEKEVIALLGPPTDTEYFSGEAASIYYLGAERGFIRIDSEWLLLWYDGRDKVVKQEIRTD
ncbi:hypothetical protein [Peribacillus muralis]|nr:hypothetical protein [Peribacillus muralis]